MPMSAKAVAERNKRAEEQLNTIGLCLASVLGVALVCGIGKTAVDMTKTGQSLGRPKQPWERC
jgi:hypothetical protein